MATQILATGTTVGEQSSEITHVDGTPKTYVLTGSGTMRLLFKDAAAALNDTGIELSTSSQQSCKLDADGVFRWVRADGNCGVQQG